MSKKNIEIQEKFKELVKDTVYNHEYSELAYTTNDMLEILYDLHSWCRDIKQENEKLKCFQKFYLHIRRELNELSVLKDHPELMHKKVCCKICGKTFEEITGVPEILDV